MGRGTGAWKSGRGYGETLPAGSERRIESAGDARSGIGDSDQVRSVVVVVVVRGGDEQLGGLRGTGDFGDVLGVKWTGESGAGPIDAPGTQPQVRVDASWKARRHRYAAAMREPPSGSRPRLEYRFNCAGCSVWSPGP